MLRKTILNRQTPFYLITFSILIGLTLPILIQDGMFMDGMLYTSVSHNLSMGIGTFWFPRFSLHNIAGLSSFHEQPPLVFGIQAVFFKIFGDSMYVERFYIFLTLMGSVFLILLLWKEIFRNYDDLKKMGWLPLLFWITIPVCWWSYSNNMQENTMSIFTLCAVLFIFKSLRATKYQTLLLILAGGLIFCASLCKGLPGFFPIAVPFLYWLTICNGSFKKAVFQTSVIILVPLIVYGIIFFLIPESKESLSIYFYERALHRMNEVPTVGNRLYIIFRLFMELLPPIIFVVIFIYISKFLKYKVQFRGNTGKFGLFILIGLSASVPLVLTLVQKGFYLVPSFPFFAIGSAILIAPTILNWIKRINTKSNRFRAATVLCILLMVSSITFTLSQKGKTSRNKGILHDVYVIGKIVPKGTTLTIPKMMWNEWDLQCYLVRYFNISLEYSRNNSYYIKGKYMQIKVPDEYHKVELKTLKYDLYYKK